MIGLNKKLCQLGLIGLLVVGLGWSQVPAWAADGGKKIQVVASFSILADLVKQIGGERVTVTTIVGAGGDTHVYQPIPSDAVAMSQAALMVINGLGFDNQIAQMARNAKANPNILVATARVKPLYFKADGQGHDAAQGDSHGDSQDVSQGDVPDPHAWQDPKNVVLYVEDIAQALVKLDPDHAAYYQTNLGQYRAQLRQLDAELGKIFAAWPQAVKKIITSHDAFGYFGRAYGVTFLAPLGFATENEASAAAVAALIGQIRREKIKMILVENISDPRIMRQIARETGAVVGPPLYSDALSPPGLPAENYMGMMRYNSKVFLDALAQAKSR
ncbi:MAG: zinc ABC transporter substrate-binding protein [Candidatus Symbiobacter sp.]|nr:zinc ABC transporter substrate-binding protein [Candidatus Symbiobacter sp.]